MIFPLALPLLLGLFVLLLIVMVLVVELRILRYAYRKIGLAGVAIEQGIKDREQQNKERGVFFFRKRRHQMSGKRRKKIESKKSTPSYTELFAGLGEPGKPVPAAK